MKCSCGGRSEVLERRGHRRRRRCVVCGQRWTTIEVRIGVKAASLPPALAKLGYKAKQAQVKHTPRPLDDDEFLEVIDSDDDLRTCLPELFNGR